MEQLSLFGHIDKGTHGTKWWHGNYECRNFHGYFQDRENGIGPWKFIIHSFDDYCCAIYAIDDLGEFRTLDVPIDQNSRITVAGRKYGNNNWRH